MAASGQQYTPLPGAPTAEAVAVNLGDVSSKRRAWRGGLCECFGAHMLAGCFTDALPQSALRPHASAGAYVVISSAIFPCPKRCQSLFWFGARRRLLCCRFWHLLPRDMGSVHRLRVRLPAPESDGPS